MLFIMRGNKYVALCLTLLLIFTLVSPSIAGAAGGESTPKVSVAQKLNVETIYQDANRISTWAYDHVGLATQKGFVNGSNGKVNPKEKITRAEFAKLMVSVLGLNTETEKAIMFTDVKDSDWFYPYVNVAYKEKIVSGYDNNKFLPNQQINREEMATMIVRVLGIEDMQTNTDSKDFNKVSKWAQSSVKAILGSKLMEGSNNNFNPKDIATREMAIVVAMRAYNYNPEAADTDISIVVERTIEKTATFMQQMIPSPTIASVGGEWTVLGLARSGEEVPDAYYKKYYSNVEKKLIEKDGKLHPVKYTEYDRVILALSAIGKDIMDVAGYDLREPLADFNTLIIQGINGPIFALIALDSQNYEIPIVESVKVQTTREMLIDFILNREIDGGGWALGENALVADPDITAMAIQGLTPYYNTNPDVKKALDRGISWLSKTQDAKGGYQSWEASNSESVAQVVVALSGLGIDPHTDARFVKNGKSALDNLLSYAAPGGGFYHIKSGELGNGGANPGEVDAMATDQAMYALVAYKRFIDGNNRLYDMNDIVIRVSSLHPSLH